MEKTAQVRNPSALRTSCVSWHHSTRRVAALAPRQHHETFRNAKGNNGYQLVRACPQGFSDCTAHQMLYDLHGSFTHHGVNMHNTHLGLPCIEEWALLLGRHQVRLCMWFRCAGSPQPECCWARWFPSSPLLESAEGNNGAQSCSCKTLTATTTSQWHNVL